MKNNDPMFMKMPLNFAKEIEALSPKVIDQIRAISNIGNVQVALLLLRQVNNSVLTYTLLTACPATTKKVVKDISKEVANALAVILKCSKHSIKKTWSRIHMPIGPGLGFVDLRRITEPAYLASLLFQATLTLNGLKSDKFPHSKVH